MGHAWTASSAAGRWWYRTYRAGGGWRRPPAAPIAQCSIVEESSKYRARDACGVVPDAESGCLSTRPPAKQCPRRYPANIKVIGQTPPSRARCEFGHHPRCLCLLRHLPTMTTPMPMLRPTPRHRRRRAGARSRRRSGGRIIGAARGLSPRWRAPQISTSSAAQAHGRAC